ncbi:alpha/beta fold hydrolase [Mangrovitalea sediminis]|uniref:alpha/beta fold hydrolase n=1 Tax=Mangrovitalea sediminis TaxID=1982043 RepID=UPI000BE56E8D|nr:alpha/beta hydrolase [Mangrovitalea sediminis]
MTRMRDRTREGAPWSLSLKHLDVAGLTWGSPEHPLILCLHGWLDNAASFSRLGPAFAEAYHVIAVDLAGHGHSGHRPPGDDYALLDYVRDVAEIVAALGKQRLILIGHSLGGIIASLYASAFPEKIERLVMIDSLGPRTLDETRFAEQLRKAIDQRLNDRRSQPRIYADRSDAVAARETGALALSRWGAERIVDRNLKVLDEGFGWRTDRRLRDASMMYLSEPQVRGYLSRLTMPSLLVTAEAGVLAKALSHNDRLGSLEDVRVVGVTGTHHCHLEAESAPVVAETIRNFLL